MKEKWINLKGELEGYSISNKGNVRGKTGTILTQSLSGKHLKVSINRKRVIVAYLVAREFLTTYKHGMGIRYKDGNPLNLDLDNLELFNKNEEHFDKSKPNKEQLKELLNQGLSMKDIAVKLSTTHTFIGRLMSLYDLNNEPIAQTPIYTQQTEIWVKIENSAYEVSNFGQIRNSETKRKLKPYKTLSVVATNGKLIYISLPKLVANTFVPNPHKYRYLTYLDGNSTNYRADNLKWVRSRKIRDRAQNNTYYEEVPQYIKDIIIEIVNGAKVRDICEKYGFNMSCLVAFGFPSSAKKLIEQHRHHLTQGTWEQYLTGDLNKSKIPLLDGEEFKPIEGYPGLFVSNIGRVISKLTFTKERLKTLTIVDGFPRVVVYSNRINSTLFVKDLVARHWVDNPDPSNLTKVINKNGDRNDCRAENLTWVSKGGTKYD